MFNKMRKRYDEKLSKEFLPEALEIVEKPASPVGHLMLWITIAIILLFLLWSILGRVDETANARGKIITVDGTQTLQSVNEGVITKIYVKEGDKVKKGDKIIALDSSLEKASLNYSKQHSELLELKIDLLNKVVEGKDIRVYIKKTDDSDELNIINYAVALQEEKESSLDQYEAEVAAQEKQITIEKYNLEVLENHKISLILKQIELENQYKEDGIEEKKLQLVKEKVKNLMADEKTYKELYESDAIAKVEWENKQEELKLAKEELNVQKKSAENEKISIKEKLQDLKNQISENDTMIEIQKTKIGIEEDNLERAETALISAKSSSSEAILNLIVQANSERRENEVAVGEKEENLENQVITAPFSGIVQAIAVNTVGGVVAPAQDLVEIVPNNSQLIFEANLLNKDVGFVKLNQEASIKMDTYNYQKYGKLNGTIIYISPDAIEDEKTGLLVYKVKIKVDLKAFDKVHSNLAITTGMQGTVEIKTGSRRIIEFFLEPLIKNLDESLKVR